MKCRPQAPVVGRLTLTEERGESPAEVRSVEAPAGPGTCSCGHMGPHCAGRPVPLGPKEACETGVFSLYLDVQPLPCGSFQPESPSLPARPPVEMCAPKPATGFWGLNVIPDAEGNPHLHPHEWDYLPPSPGVR